MTPQEEQFAVDVTDHCEDHDQWVSLIRFGLDTLIKSPDLLIELIVREADRQRERTGLQHRRTSDDAAAILRELGLRFVPASPAAVPSESGEG